DGYGLILAAAFTGMSPDGNRPTLFDIATLSPETSHHIMGSPDSIHTTLFDAAGVTYFGEREDVKLAFGDTGHVVNEQLAAHQSMATAQPLGDLPGLTVPNTLLAGADFGATFQVKALD